VDIKSAMKIAAFYIAAGLLAVRPFKRAEAGRMETRAETWMKIWICPTGFGRRRAGTPEVEMPFEYD
jgi:hypothetical protein